MSQQFHSTGAATPVGIPSVDTRVVGTAAVLFATGMVYLTRTVHIQQAMLFLVGGVIGLLLYHASFGFTSAWRVFIADRRETYCESTDQTEVREQ